MTATGKMRMRGNSYWTDAPASLWRLPVAFVAALLLLLPAASASAHQPYFEEGDFTAATPFTVNNPLISTALYATLDTATDMDFYTFTGTQGDRVEIGVTIPQIAGQEAFAPVVALLGSGLPAAAVSGLDGTEAAPLLADGNGAYLLEPVAATPFYEPFSRTNYWRRQREKVSLPGDGSYTVVVWSRSGERGRYVLVIGDREVPGGDPLFPLKMSSYWTPLAEGGSDGPAAGAHQPGSRPVSENRSACGWLDRLRSLFNGQGAICAP